MKACIYARSSQHDKGHHSFTIEHQEKAARSLASKHGLTVAYEHVFTDVDYAGECPPSCWVYGEDQEGRPALSALISAIEEGLVKRIIVRKMDRLGTTSEVLTGILELLTQHDVYIVATPETAGLSEDPTEAFAVSILHPRIQYDTNEERRTKALCKQKKIEELNRLMLKIARLEAEIAELSI